MSKQRDDEHIPVMGFFTPHDQKATNWTGEILDPKTGELVKEPSVTKQSFKEECDINNIVRDFTKSGQVAHINERAGAFVDLPDAFDYQQGLDMVRHAQAAFDALPAQIRARFGNLAENFLAFCEDPANAAELIELGLAEARPQAPAPQAPPPPEPAPPTPPPAPKA